MRLPLRVLVVAESSELRRAITRVMELRGYLVDVADTIELARRLDDATPCVAALVDVDLGAVEFARDAHAPVVAMSAHPDWAPPAGARLRALLRKPFGHLDLDAALAKVLTN